MKANDLNKKFFLLDQVAEHGEKFENWDDFEAWTEVENLHLGNVEKAIPVGNRTLGTFVAHGTMAHVGYFIYDARKLSDQKIWIIPEHKGNEYNCKVYANTQWSRLISLLNGGTALCMSPQQ